MDWQTIVPYIIAAAVGILIGVIATMIPYRKRGDEYAYRIRDVESKLKNSDRDLTDTRGQVESLTANTRAIETTLSETQTKLADTEKLLADTQTQLADTESVLAQTKATLADTETKVQNLSGDNAQLTSTLQARALELGGVVAAMNALQGQFDEANNKIGALTGELEGANTAIATYKTNEEATAQALAAKEAELEGLQKSLAEAAGLKESLEVKLKGTRSEVAAELAILTSTMIKLKEEQLGEAEGKLHDLQKQLSALKDGQLATE